MGKGVKFTKRSSNRIGRSVRTTEGYAPHDFAQRPKQIPPDEGEIITHRFTPSESSSTSVDISEGAWIHVTGRFAADASGLGDSSNRFIIAELDDFSAPSSLSITAESALPAYGLRDKKRVLCELEFSGGIISNIIRYQFGDIVDDVVRGTNGLFKGEFSRAYLISDDSIVAAGTPYNPSTMYYAKTYDFLRTT